MESGKGIQFNVNAAEEEERESRRLAKEQMKKMATHSRTKVHQRAFIKQNVKSENNIQR